MDFPKTDCEYTSRYGSTMAINKLTAENFKKWRRKGKAFIALNNSVLLVSLKMNVRRLYLAAYFMLLARLAFIVFLFGSPAAGNKLWLQGILTAHVTCFLAWLFILFYSRFLEKRANFKTKDQIFIYAAVLINFAFGIALTLFDQLVTNSITPLILVSVFVGILLYLRPLLSGIIYGLAFFVFYSLLPLAVADQNILFSHRINSLSVLGLGLLASLLNWFYFLSSARQDEKIRAQQEELESMAFYDQLTGLCNRHLFNRLVEKELSEIDRYGHSSVLIIFDIDDFKLINDQYGHAVGDLVLQQLAALVRGNIRQSDTIARFGGEEFMILAPNLTLSEGYAFAEKLRQLIANEFFGSSAAASSLTASFGVSLLQPSEAGIRPPYFSQADSALYLAKQSGKNKTVKLK